HDAVGGDKLEPVLQQCRDSIELSEIYGYAPVLATMAIHEISHFTGPFAQHLFLPGPREEEAYRMAETPFVDRLQTLGNRLIAFTLEKNNGAFDGKKMIPHRHMHLEDGRAPAACGVSDADRIDQIRRRTIVRHQLLPQPVQPVA